MRFRPWSNGILTRSPTRRNPVNPTRDFPSTLTQNGQWAKTIKGVKHYFGPWDDPDAALERYERTKYDLQAGRAPSPVADGQGVPLYHLCNLFLERQERNVEQGRLQKAQCNKYQFATDLIIERFGPKRTADTLRPVDWSGFYDELAKHHKGYALRNRIQEIRRVFRWAYEMELVDRPMRYGEDFVPSNFAAPDPDDPSVAFTREELKLLLEVGADSREQAKQWRAILLLAFNGMFGQADVAGMPFQHLFVDSSTPFHDYPRTRPNRRSNPCISRPPSTRAAGARGTFCRSTHTTALYAAQKSVTSTPSKNSANIFFTAGLPRDRSIM